MPCLLTVQGSPIELERNSKYVLGRAADCDIVLEDLAASRRHACLIVGRLPHALHVEDMESHNGVFLNGVKIHSATLREGDTIQLGDVILIYHEGA